METTPHPHVTQWHSTKKQEGADAISPAGFRKAPLRRHSERNLSLTSPKAPAHTRLCAHTLCCNCQRHIFAAGRCFRPNFPNPQDATHWGPKGLSRSWRGRYFSQFMGHQNGAKVESSCLNPQWGAQMDWKPNDEMGRGTKIGHYLLLFRFTARKRTNDTAESRDRRKENVVCYWHDRKSLKSHDPAVMTQERPVSCCSLDRENEGKESSWLTAPPSDPPSTPPPSPRYSHKQSSRPSSAERRVGLAGLSVVIGCEHRPDHTHSSHQQACLPQCSAQMEAGSGSFKEKHWLACSCPIWCTLINQELKHQKGPDLWHHFRRSYISFTHSCPI